MIVCENNNKLSHIYLTSIHYFYLTKLYKFYLNVFNVHGSKFQSIKKEEFCNTSEILEVTIRLNTLPVDSYMNTELCGNKA